MSITLQQVEYAIDFFILLESVPVDYEELRSRNRHLAAQHNSLIRKFAEEMQPASLEDMQRVFYQITTSPKYSVTRVARSIARTVLSSNWNGVGEWRD